MRKLTKFAKIIVNDHVHCVFGRH